MITKDAEEDLERFIRYLIFEKKSIQAAKNVLNDFDTTIESLKHVAESLKLCDNERLRQLGYRRIKFLSHRYFMLYRIVEGVVFVDNIFMNCRIMKIGCISWLRLWSGRRILKFNYLISV